MSITVRANPANLTWNHFTVMQTVIDPADNTVQDSFTAFNFSIPDFPPRMINRRFGLAETFQITITPLARVRAGAAQDAGLLSHEQFHYDVGVVTGRALARTLMTLREPDLSALRLALNRAVHLHFFTRARLIQRRYDLDTHHGREQHYQRIWKNQMAACLADRGSTHIHGFWL